MLREPRNPARFPTLSRHRVLRLYQRPVCSNSPVVPETANRRLSIEISAANPPTLERIRLEETTGAKTTEIANYQPSDGGGWKVGTMALTLYFIEAALWAMQPGSSGDFAPAVPWSTASQSNGAGGKKKNGKPKNPSQHPYHTLAGEIAKPTWLKLVFPSRNATTEHDVRHYFEATDGDYRDKRTGEYRRLRLRQGPLPVSAVTVFRATKPLTSDAKLRELFDDLWKQWANTNGTHEISSQLVSLAPETAPQKVEPPTVVAIPPAIQKLLDEASKLTDADKFAEAIPRLEKALNAAIKAKHSQAEAKARIHLSKAVFESTEDYVAGEEHSRKALALFGNEPSINRHTALHGLGDMLLWAGRLDEAGAVIRSSLEVARTIADQDSVARSLISVSLLERALGNTRESADRLDEAIQILHQLSLGQEGKKRVSTAHALGVCYANKAQLARDDGRPDEAHALYEKAQEQHAVSGDTLNSGKAHLLVGNMQCGGGNAEAGFQSFKKAMAAFVEVKNPLWMARTTKSVARLNAQHERWEEAARAALAAKDGFAEANAKGELVEAILFAADILAQLVKATLRDDVQSQIHEMCKQVPKEREAYAAAALNSQMKRIHAEIDEQVRTDSAVGNLLREARELAEKHQLHEEQAECLVAECRLRLAKADEEGRKRLFESALTCLKRALPTEDFPKRKGHLMGRIASLCRELGQKRDWAGWVKRVGEVFEKAGDVYGIANYHLEMAGVHRSQGNLDGQIASERKALELIEGRSFHDISAAARINLADGLRLRREFHEAQKLLSEAEEICEAHKFQGMVNEISQIRSRIEEEVSAAQAATHTLPQMLCSLHQLIRHRPAESQGYLAFWYYAWKTELMTVLRSGPGVTLLVVTDEAERFIEFSTRFSGLAEHFAMATTTEPIAVKSSNALNIPRSWGFPAGYVFMGVRKKRTTARESEEMPPESSDAPPRYRVIGPARQFPFYNTILGSKGAHAIAGDTPRLPVEAMDLMLNRPVKELIKRRAVWFPHPRQWSDDPFLTDLRMGYERWLFPTYFDRLPSSESVTVVGSTTIHMRRTLPDEPTSESFSKWKRSLLKLTRMSKANANVALHDLADCFASAITGETVSFEVHLFEFPQIDQMVVFPALLFRGI